MDENGCGSDGVWNVFLDIKIDYALLSIYYWRYLQAGLCAEEDCCSAGVDQYLIQIENLQDSFRQDKVVFSSLWFNMTIIHDNVDATVP